MYLLSLQFFLNQLTQIILSVSYELFLTWQHYSKYASVDRAWTLEIDEVFFFYSTV